MKKFLAIVCAAATLTACNNEADTTTETTTTADSNAAANVETTEPSSGAYTPVEGDVSYRESKVMVMRNGAWVEADQDVKFDNGVTVYRNGRVERNDMEIELREGEIVNRTGDFFDRSGVAIGNAWDATKEGAKDAGRAVKKTAKKIGQKVEDAVDGDKKDNN